MKLYLLLLICICLLTACKARKSENIQSTTWLLFDRSKRLSTNYLKDDSIILKIEISGFVTMISRQFPDSAYGGLYYEKKDSFLRFFFPKDEYHNRIYGTALPLRRKIDAHLRENKKVNADLDKMIKNLSSCNYMSYYSKDTLVFKDSIRYELSGIYKFRKLSSENPQVTNQ